ncbi:MAG: IPT/TIG domain-containing protein [Prosthecobacter sp.]|jgi:hypothetical protein|uniref:beta strand repeat-containing protein n=1 Tax=Prosthecobacter sp. TaxID=1965333 RepID=UPI0019E1691F|nr:IPT/TIG domain-containing protein [Prosthecobacter sp.]MBE2284561.1 IPT/TIG domain-containing protein [Prosthecobacter sp.]
MKSLLLRLLFFFSLPLSAAPSSKPQQITSPDQVPQGLEKSDWASIRAAHTAWEHSFMPLEGGGFQARNKGQQWTAAFDGQGFEAKPKDADWRWGLELRSYGFGSLQTTVQGEPEVKADGLRLSYQWDAAVQEWFVNDQRGLEHGFTLDQRPKGAGGGVALDVVLGIRGTLKASVAADAQTVYFRDEAGAPVVTYAGLKVWDADGQVLPSRFVAGHEGGIVVRVEEGGARYPITIDPIAQQAYLKPSLGSSGYGNALDLLGISIAIDGDTVIVGATGEDSSTSGVNSIPDEAAVNSGAAYVFVRSGTTWTQQAYLKAAQPSAGDNFGNAVAVSGDTVIVGAQNEDSSTSGINSTPDELAGNAGAAYVFVRNGTSWSQQAYLKAAQVTADDVFGISVAANGDTVVVGAYNEDSSTTGINSTPNELASGAGAAYVFVRSGTTWTQQAYLKPAKVTANDRFGRSVGISADTVIVGAMQESSSTTGVNSTPNTSASSSGAAYVFVRNATTWTQQAYLKASQVTGLDFFGISVAVSGDTVVVGAIGEDSSTSGINSTANELASSSGAAYVFVRSGTVWSQQAYLKASQVSASDNFGNSVAVSGNTVVVGSPQEDSGTAGINSTPDELAGNSGAVYVYVRSGTTWTQQAYLKSDQVLANNLFGTSVAVSGDTILVGTPQEDSSTTGINSTPDEGALNAGAGYVFVRNGTTWTQQAYMKVSPENRGYAGADDQFGASVAASGDMVVVGSPGEDSTTAGVNSIPDDGALGAGAAYVFVRNGTTWTQQACLKASQVTAGDSFGSSVAASGDTVVVGSAGEDSTTAGVNSIPDEGATSAGAAYVFVRSGGAWTQQAYLKASQVSAGDFFGRSVAVSGNTVVVGAMLEDSSTTGIDSTPDEASVDAGAAYVFVRNGVTWTQQAYLKAAQVSANDNFGISVAVSGDTVVAGAHQEDGSTTGVNGTPDEAAVNSGAAYVFVRSGTTWSQQAYLKASQVTLGDQFGSAVAASGDTVVVGASAEDSSTTGINSTPDEAASSSGAAYVFARSGTTWSQQAYLKASQVSANDFFGISVAVSDDTVVVGAYNEASGTTGINSTPDEAATGAGAAYVYVRAGTTWTQQAYLKASQVTAGDSFGFSVTVSMDTVVVGANQEDGSASGINSPADELVYGAGAAYIFTGLGPAPTIIGVTPAVGSAAGGTSLAITGTGFNGTTSVTIGGATASFSVIDGANITATAPAHVPGLVDVTVTNLVGTSVGSNLYTYANAPIVAFVNAAGGGTSGNTIVTIYGGNFTNVTAVTFGGTAAASFAVASDTQITATTPAHTAGLVNVDVTASGLQGSGTNLFRYASASNSTDTDGDGLNDAAELYLAAFGFDPGTAQPAQVTAFLSGNAIFNQAQFDTNRTTGRNDVITDPNPYDLYTTSQVQALHFPTPLIKHNPATGVFTLTLGVQKSTTLMPGSFQPFSMTTAPDAVRTFNSEGKLEFQFTSPDKAAFFRLSAQ